MDITSKVTVTRLISNDGSSGHSYKGFLMWPIVPGNFIQMSIEKERIFMSTEIVATTKNPLNSKELVVMTTNSTYLVQLGAENDSHSTSRTR